MLRSVKKRELGANGSQKALIVVVAFGVKVAPAFLSRYFGRGTCTRITGFEFWDWRYNAVERLF
jgi:hypothetical protein